MARLRINPNPVNQIRESGGIEVADQNPNPNPNPNPADTTPPTPAAKTFTQDEVNDIVTKRLTRDRASLYKTLGIEDESKLPDIIAKVKAHDDIKPKYEQLLGEVEHGKNASVLRAAGIDDAFVEYALGKIPKGETPEAYKANAEKFAKENPKMLREKFNSTDATLPLGGSANLPDFAKMTDEEYMAWSRKNRLDGTAKK